MKFEAVGNTGCDYISAAEGVWPTSVWQFQDYRKNYIPILIFSFADKSYADEKTCFQDQDGSDNWWQLAAGKTCCIQVACAAPFDKSFCRNNYKTREVAQSYRNFIKEGFGPPIHVGLVWMYGALATLL